MIDRLKVLSDCTEIAHARIQQEFADINPVVGVSRKLRQAGIPADVLTIDCLKSGKRIIVILHDEAPNLVRYQFSYKDQDPGDVFENLEFSALSEENLYDWMKSYFS